MSDEAEQLYESLKETRDAAAALMRAMCKADVVDEVMRFVDSRHEGFGVRANAALAAWEKVRDKV